MLHLNLEEHSWLLPLCRCYSYNNSGETQALQIQFHILRRADLYTGFLQLGVAVGLNACSISTVHTGSGSRRLLNRSHALRALQRVQSLQPADIQCILC